MSTINFQHGALIRSGPKLVNGGKWDAMLDDSVRDAHTSANLTIYISIHFQQINPVRGQTGVHADADANQKRIQKWGPGEFTRFKSNLLHQAQRYWSGKFWLKTPATYKFLDWPETNSTHHCNIYCKLELSEASNPGDAHYTIAVVRAQDGENFRSHSRLYSQRDIQSENLIANSTVKFWTHFHEVGHLIGLGHVGYHGHRNLHHDNQPTAYGVTLQDQSDVMGKGSTRHAWHALPWQQAAAVLTGTAKSAWHVHQNHISPTPISHGHNGR